MGLEPSKQNIMAHIDPADINKLQSALRTNLNKKGNEKAKAAFTMVHYGSLWLSMVINVKRNPKYIRNITQEAILCNTKISSDAPLYCFV